MLNWNDIHSVFLDMDGTLLDLHFDDHFWQEFLPEQYASHHNLSLESAMRYLQAQMKAKEGTLDWYCVDHWSHELNMDIPTLKTQVAHLIAVHDGVLEFLDAVNRLGKRTILVTNAHRKVLTLKMHHTGLQGHFDAMICSHEIGYPKEDPKFWGALQNVEPFHKQHTLFADDSLPVLRSANTYGIRYLYSIAKPSSKKPARIHHEFRTLNSFAEITP